MSKMTWVNFHLAMILILGILSSFSEISSDKKANNIEKDLNNKEKNSISETIAVISILIIVAGIFCCFIMYFFIKRQIIIMGIGGIFGIVYVYFAIKQMVQMIFIPENREFSISDIKNFVYVYVVWWLMMAALVISPSKVNIFEEEFSNYQEIVKIVILLFQYYFNIFFALGGLYILLFYLREFIRKPAAKFRPILKIIRYTIVTLGEPNIKYKKLKCFKLWERNYRKNVMYKILMTIPFMILDILQVAYLFIENAIKLVVVFAIVGIWDLVNVLCKSVRKLWNRHKNNEWLYIFAQMAGVCSYIIVFIAIQYGEYIEATKNIYEFAGTIILIPYFLGKIASLKKALKENEFQIIHKEKKVESVLTDTIHNENGESVIDTSRTGGLEYDVTKDKANNSQKNTVNDTDQIRKELRQATRDNCAKKIKKFFENNIEIVVGICISIFLVGVYLAFKSLQNERNISMLGSVIGAEGAILSVLLSISFMKKSNEKTLDASVLPYLSVKKDTIPSEHAYAFEYFKIRKDKTDFDGWRKFDFDTISNDKIKLARNGIAYLHIKNIGIGPAIHLKLKIENFSNVYLPIDYLRPDEELDLILNFNNPDNSYRTDIVLRYETIRGTEHSQRFHANITWHLDRTNFTLFD